MSRVLLSACAVVAACALCIPLVLLALALPRGCGPAVRPPTPRQAAENLKGQAHSTRRIGKRVTRIKV